MDLSCLVPKVDGGLGQADGLFQRIAMLLQQLFDDGEVGIQRGERRIAVEFLLELGELVVQLPVMATTGLHQFTDELDAAGSLCIGKSDYAV